MKSFDVQNLALDNQTYKRRRLVKTFGWLIFGFSIIYFFTGLFMMLGSSMMGIAEEISRHDRGNEIPEDALILMKTVQSLYFYSGLFTFLASIILIPGAIGYATLKEWGRNTFLAGCLAAITCNFYYIYMTTSMMSSVADVARNAPHNDMPEVVSDSFGSIGLVAGILYTIIPIGFLVTNVIIASKQRTKLAMKG